MRAGLMGLVVIVFATSAWGANDLTNGSFDSSIDGWWFYPGTTTASHRGDTGSDLAGGSGPGCLELSSNEITSGLRTAQQRLDMTPGGVYRLRGSYYLPSAGNSAGEASLHIRWENGDNRIVTAHWILEGLNITDAWVRLDQRIIVPDHIVGAEVLIGFAFRDDIDPATAPPGMILWDDLELEPVDKTGQQLFVPAAASAPGLAGTHWTTTAWFTNPTDLEVSLFATFMPRDSFNYSTLSETVKIATIAPHATITIEDLVARLGHSGEAGAIYLEALVPGTDVADPLLTGLTLTGTPFPDGPGGYGQALPVVTADAPDELWVTGIVHGADRRTNLGLVNGSEGSRDMVIQVFDSDGVLIAEYETFLRDFQNKQWSMQGLGVASIDGGSARIVPTGNSILSHVFAYISSVDQNTGDAIFKLAE